MAIKGKNDNDNDNDVLDDEEDENSVLVTETKKIVKPIRKKTDVKKSGKRKLNTKNVSTVSSHVITRNLSKKKHLPIS